VQETDKNVVDRNIHNCGVPAGQAHCIAGPAPWLFDRFKILEIMRIGKRGAVTPLTIPGLVPQVNLRRDIFGAELNGLVEFRTVIGGELLPVVGRAC